VPLLVVSFPIFGSGMASLHAHESDIPHSHGVVHSHFEPHQPLLPHDDRELELDHGDHILWLDMAVVHALPFQLDAPVAVLRLVPDPVTCSRCWSTIVFDEGAPPHGPPRETASLRAPPALPA
jgi:hypothetical protein